MIGNSATTTLANTVVTGASIPVATALFTRDGIRSGEMAALGAAKARSGMAEPRPADQPRRRRLRDWYFARDEVAAPS